MSAPLPLSRRLELAAIAAHDYRERGDALGRPYSRDRDPLLEVIPGDTTATRATLDAVETVTGRTIRAGQNGVIHTAPAARAALRRWAAR